MSLLILPLRLKLLSLRERAQSGVIDMMAINVSDPGRAGTVNSVTVSGKLMTAGTYLTLQHQASACNHRKKGIREIAGTDCTLRPFVRNSHKRLELNNLCKTELTVYSHIICSSTQESPSSFFSLHQNPKTCASATIKAAPTRRKQGRTECNAADVGWYWSEARTVYAIMPST